MPSSVHSAHQISQIADQGWAVYLSSAIPELVHMGVRDVTLHGVSTLRSEGLAPTLHSRVTVAARRKPYKEDIMVTAKSLWKSK